MSESIAPVYGAATDTSANAPKRKTRVHHLQAMKAAGERWAMLTAYDFSTARIFEEAGIPVLLVGDSAANNVYGHETTLPVTVDELRIAVDIPLARPERIAVQDVCDGKSWNRGEVSIADVDITAATGLLAARCKSC